VYRGVYLPPPPSGANTCYPPSPLGEVKTVNSREDLASKGG